MIASAKMSMVLMDCLSVPNMIGIGPTSTIPAAFVSVLVVRVFERPSSSMAIMRIIVPVIMRPSPIVKSVSVFIVVRLWFGVVGFY